MTSLNIKDYTIEELLQFANIYDKRIENVTKEEIIKGIDQRLVRSMQLQRPGYSKFFHKIKEFLLRLIEITKERTNEDEKKDEHDGGWTNAYKEKIKIPKIEKKKSSINPFYSLIINSQHRKLIQYPDPKIDLDNSAGGCGTLEEVFPKNPKTYAEPENNFTVTLSTAMKGVIKLRVSQIEIPISWYTFKKCNGTTCFKMGPATLLGETYYPIDAVADYTKLIKIGEGNYAEQELINNLQEEMIHNFGLDPSNNPNYKITYSVTTKKTTISATTHPSSPFNKNFNLFFYLEKTPTIKATTDSPEIPGISEMIFDPSCDKCKSGIPKVDYNLGWLLGFRGTRYTGKTSYTSEGMIDTYGPKTIGVELNDFTNNSGSDTVVTIREEGDTFSRVRGIEDCNPPVNTEETLDFSKSDQGLKLLSCRPPRNAEHPDVTSDGDLIQSTTKNLFYAKQQERRAWKPIVNRSRPYGNSFARLQVKKNEGNIIFAEPSDHRSERNYFGPVTISRINLKLFDDRGEYLDLNGNQWSIRIDVESVY